MANTPKRGLMTLDLKKAILERRQSVSHEEWTKLGHWGVERILHSEEWQQFSHRESIRIGLYSSLPDEPNLKDLESLAQQKDGVRLYYPRISDVRAKRMDLVEVSPFHSDSWVKGAYGIFEPKRELRVATDSELKELDLIFIPGVVFGENGERWGRGAGYYDRFLPRVSRAIRVAFAFEFQLFKKLEQEVWDQKVDWIVTECREIRTPRFLEKWKLILK